jgi:uncharacterized membrane protein
MVMIDEPTARTPLPETAERSPDVLPLLLAAGAGAALMYFLDPARGGRRRHLVADKAVHAVHVAGDAAGTTGRDLSNRARGLAARVRNRFGGDEPDDVVLAERVRAELGRLVSHPGSLTVSAADGQVTVSGVVLEREADDLLRGIGKVRGVSDVDDRLERHATAGDIPGLQGDGRPQKERFELMQENWTPAARLATMLVGGTVAVLALRSEERGNPLAAAAAASGLALFARGATNLPFSRLLGVGAGRHAVTVQKSINIAAPVDEVFAWLTEWERWPEWMTHVREIKASGSRGAEGELTRWTVDGPAGKSVTWDAVTTRIQPPELVAWKTTEGSPIAHAGRLRMVPTDEGFTRVDVHLSYNPIAGAAGHAIAALLGKDPKRQLDDDLSRLKSTIETGRAPHDAAAHDRMRDLEQPGEAEARP